ncbi:hypothetical protein [Aeromonas veronii]|uniref:hypothetical protein n=1 Tax=Aeromonas veronii TaxID=654 RepID=UPI00214D8619|nr:hypothetical protein [Aeromonas veronii]MCR3968894.1 hypothetical protein [Aeromonas veronii]MCR3981342.1 hypothetical protein [Aeromonas veronii]
MSITTENLNYLGTLIANSTAEQPEKHEMLAFLAEMEDAQKEMDKLLLTLAVMFDQNDMQEMGTECRKFIFK